MVWWKKGFSLLLIVALIMTTTPAMAEEPQQASDAPLPEFEVPSKPGNQSVQTREVTEQGEEDPSVIHEERTEEPVAPGMTLTRFNRFDTEGWLQGAIMSVDLSEETVKTDLLTPGKVAESAPLSEQMKESGAIAGVNGDFFDISNTQATIGAEVQSGKLLKSGSSLNAMVTADKLGRISQLLLQGTVTAGEKHYALSGVNALSVGADELVMFTSQWGDASRSHLKVGADEYAEVLLSDGKVVEILSGEVYAGPISNNETVLSGKGNGAAFLQSLAIGTDVQIAYETNPQYKDLLFAVGGNVQLVKDGKINTTDDGDRHPRTAVGFSQDGKRMILAAVDGRSNDSRGMTYLELAKLMKAEGAWMALNLDGGGSTTMVSRPLGQDALSVVNHPSDGSERSIPNGIGVWSEAKSGKLKGFRIEAHSDRVFPGLTRTFRAFAYDTAYAPFEMDDDQIKWRGYPGKIGGFEGNVFKAKHPGKGDVRAQYRGVKSEVPVHVLGEPVSLAIEPSLIGLESGGSDTFLVTGEDREGYSTFIEPRDVKLTYDKDVIDIKANDDGSFTVTPRVESGATMVTAQVGKLKTYLGVTVSLEARQIDNFEDQTNPWTFFKFPSEVKGSLEYVDAPDREGQAIKLSYDFTTTTRTRAVYAFPPGGSVELPGDVKKLGVNVYGNEANGHWLRARIIDAAGAPHVLDLDFGVDWNGWKYVEADIPPGVVYPVRLDRIYLVETDRNKQDTGYVMFDDVTVKVTQPLDLPEQERAEDPLILEYGELPENMWKFAVISDLQLVADNPDSKEIRNAKKVLQAVNKEEDVEFVLFNGDVVDYDTDEQYAFAKTLIEENLDLPYYVVPGNHEVYGTDSLDNFHEAFGEDHQTFDHEGTRFILMNTAFGGLRLSNPEQWFMIKSALESAMTDDSIHNVVLLGHHPLKDPLPDGAHDMTDQKEADLLESLLTDFREQSGKPAIVISAHAQMVNLDRRDGIAYMITGPVGKGTYAAPDNGGFYNYALFGVDPRVKPDERQAGHLLNKHGKPGKEWIQAEIRPVLEDVTIAKSEYTVGEWETIEWTGVQAEGWRFPLKYPATLQYEGSDKLVIKGQKQRDHRHRAIAEFNPEDQTIRFFREGSVELTVRTGDFVKTFMLEGKK